jgi:hypothetical protein
MKKQILVGAALVVIGVAAGSLLAPQAASALDFTYSFEGVTGLIEGLSEGTNACLSSDSCRVTVTNNGGTGAPVGPLQPYISLNLIEFPGFHVVTPAGGTPYISLETAFSPPTGSSWYGSLSGDVSDVSPNNFRIGFIPGYDTASNAYYTAGCLFNADTECGEAYQNQPYRATQFIYVPSGSAPEVPGPLPVFGAATAFGCSRRLRRRIKATSNNVTTAPFA